MKKTYIEWFYPGSFVSETRTEPVEDRSKPSKISKTAYAYRFFDREEIQQGRETLRGKPKNYSPMYYFGEEFTAEEALNDDSFGDIAKSNIKVNEFKRVVRTKLGQIFPLEDKDRVFFP